MLGQRIEFTLTPVQVTPPPQPTWSKTEEGFIDMEIQRLLLKGVIAHSVHEEGDFISSTFVRPKKDGAYRMILNLKSLNQYVEYHHFKLDTIWTAVHMMTPGCFMASIDLKDAYYSVHIDNLHQKYLIKSVLYPTQRLVFLGFVLDSIVMRIYLTPEKASNVKNACQRVLLSPCPLIREVAQVLGLLTSSFPGIMYGPLHYRWTEMDKTWALQENKGNFDKPMRLSTAAKGELQWWVNCVETSYNPVSHGPMQVTMITDASKTGWGCTVNGIPTGGCWDPEEAARHINYLETMDVFLGLQSFSDQVSDKHVKVLVDNTTAMACINQMGTCHSNDINTLVIKIWQWCIRHNIWLTVAHIPGKDNIIADGESRKSRRETEWALNPQIYQDAIAHLGQTPDIDLFASRLNYKCKLYVSYQPDPGAFAINAFHLSLDSLNFYAFPPFCIIQQVLQKIRKDSATGLIVVPYWPTQAWWPVLTNMLVPYPLLLPSKPNTLQLPSDPQLIHPLSKTIRLLLCLLSGDYSRVKVFQKQLQPSYSRHGGVAPHGSTVPTCGDGNSIVVLGKLIPFQQLL